MVRIIPKVNKDESLSFSFNLNAEGHIRTSRNLSWVEDNPMTVNANMAFGYKHYPKNTMNQSDWELQLMLDNILLDFRNDRFVHGGTEYYNPWPFNIVSFRMTSTHFLIHGTYKPQLQMHYYDNDIVVFECEFEHSLVLDKELINRFTHFNSNQNGKIPFDIHFKD
jgi:hypothetical protein